MRKDLPELAAYAVQKGMRAVISTNGTLITPEMAANLKDIGLSYVGISLDGMEADQRPLPGGQGGLCRRPWRVFATARPPASRWACALPSTVSTCDEIPRIFDLLEEMEIPRVCFYHLVYAGRGSKLVKEDSDPRRDPPGGGPDHGPHQGAARQGQAQGSPHRRQPCRRPLSLPAAASRKNPERAKEVLELLEMNEGNNSGRGIGCVSWDGEVHADQFWRHHSFGNVRQRPFSEIWTDTSEPLMGKLKEKKKHVKGRCAGCRWLDICGGNFRVRAEAVTDDVWAPDPACYLSDEEIGWKKAAQETLRMNRIQSPSPHGTTLADY